MQRSENGVILRSIFLHVHNSVAKIHYYWAPQWKNLYIRVTIVFVTLPLSVMPDLLENQLYSKALWFLT